MDPLYLAAKDYSKFIDKNFIYKLENGAEIEVPFKRCNFAHLLGLHKLKDINILKKLSNPNSNVANLVYKHILKKQLTYEHISKSIFFSEMSSRLDNFHFLDQLLLSEIIVNFDKSKVRKSDLKSDIILYEKKNNNYIHLCIAKDKKNERYPETFLVQPDKYYINKQDKVLVKSIHILDGKSKNIEKIYVRIDGNFIEKAIA